MNYLRTNLHHFIEQKRCTQLDLAKAAGITQPNISRFLQPTGGDLKAGSVAGIAKMLGVSIDDLMAHDFRVAPPPAKSSQLDLDLDALASALVSLDKAMQALNVPYRYVQDMAPTLRYAYKALARDPNMPNSARAYFDEALIGKLRENLDAAPARPGRRSAASSASSPKGAKT